MFATGTALAIAGLASAGGGLAQAKMQSSAAKKAAQTQQQGVQQAGQYIQQGLGQLGQLYSPFINSGTGAIGTIGRLTTPGPGARFASPGPPNAMPQMPQPGMAMPRMGGPMPSTMPGGGGGMPGGMPSGGGSAPMVRIQAPDGEVRAVPANMVQQYLAAGARPFQG